MTTLLLNICYFCHGFKNDTAVLYSMTIQVLSMKWKKNQFGGRKVVRQATVLAHWAKKVGGRLSPPAHNIGAVANDPHH